MNVKMKRIGLIGGMGWVSTAVYYKIINEKINSCLGGEHSADLVLHTPDFAEISKLMHAGEWGKLEKIVLNLLKKLENDDVDFYLFCCNTIHKFSEQLENQTHLPFLHILDPVGKLIRQNKLNRILLLGSKFTMENSFHSAYLESKFNVDVVILDKSEQNFIHRMIMDELCFNGLSDRSKQKLVTMIQTLKIKQKIDAVLLACTELTLVSPFIDNILPVYDTTQIHAEAAALYAVEKFISGQ